MICSSNGFTNIFDTTKLNVDIYIHSTYIRIIKQTLFYEKNRRFVVSKFVKLCDELTFAIFCQST